ncbi:MAG: peptide deformylase [Oscillospiraceae bacterium]|nr:peptide deformylase [Oscillospiraceae bacterium]
MALRNIFTIESDILRKKSRPVTDFGDRTHQLLEDLRDTLEKVQGLGLAAPQVGILRRVVIVLVDETDMLEMINPEIISKQGEEASDEACLSVPGLQGSVTRPTSITVKAFDRDGNEYIQEFEGMNARAVCHEMDHLEGILFVDIAEGVYSIEEPTV